MFKANEIREKFLLILKTKYAHIDDKMSFFSLLNVAVYLK